MEIARLFDVTGRRAVGAVTFLRSRAGAHLPGAVIPVDGGISTQ